MEFTYNFPFFSIMLMMLSAIISSVLGKNAARRLNIFAVSVCTLLQLALLVRLAQTGESFVYIMGHFPAPWGNEIRAGLLEAMMAFAFCGVMLLSVLGGAKHIDIDLEGAKQNLYYVMLNLIMGALLALIYTNDIFTAYVFIEIATLSTCGLLMIRQIGHTTLAAVRYMIVSLVGSGLVLIGIVLLYNLTGHLLMSNMQEAIREIVADGELTPPLMVVVTFVSMGLAIKSGLFPFHFWMPDTYGYSTPTSASVLSGLVSKGYIFLAIKIFYRVIGFDVIASSRVFDILFLFGVIAMVVGSVGAIREHDIRRMIAYSSAAQIGYIYMGIGLGTTAGVVAALFHMLTHMVTKPMLFISGSALIDISGGSKHFRELQGAGRRDKLAGLAFAVGSLSMVGFPIMAGFVSKLLFATACVHNSAIKTLPTLIVLAVSTILNAMYFLRTVIRIYRPSEEFGDLHISPDSRRKFAVSMLCFTAANVFLGMWSQPIIDAIEYGLRIFS